MLLGKQKAMLIKSRASQTHSETNVPEYKCRNSRAITFKVDFYSDISTKLENLRLNSDKNYCSYTKWKPSNNLIPSSGQLNTIPIRQLVLIENYNSKYLKLNIFFFITDLKVASILT